MPRTRFAAAMLKHGVAIALLMSLSVACGGDDEPAKLSELETEIFRGSCVFSSCHSSVSPQAELNLESPSFQALVNVASTQDPARMRVEPGNVASSYLVNKIEGLNLVAQTEEMPPGAMLSAERIERIKSWIEAGANND